MTKTALIENLTDGVYMKPKWQKKSENRFTEQIQREQEVREAQRERNKKVNALKKKWAKKLEDHQGLYDRHARQLEFIEEHGLKYRKSDDWISGRNVGMLETLEELIKDLSEI
jgi:hypothetical protein